MNINEYRTLCTSNVIAKLVWESIMSDIRKMYNASDRTELEAIQKHCDHELDCLWYYFAGTGNYDHSGYTLQFTKYVRGIYSNLWDYHFKKECREFDRKYANWMQ